MYVRTWICSLVWNIIPRITSSLQVKVDMDIKASVTTVV